MKANSAALLMALALTAPTLNLAAQDADQPRPPRPQRVQPREDGDFAGPRDGGPRERGPREDGERPRGPRPDGQGPDGPKPPIPPLIGALDANHDGVIDENEIAHASAALKKLDKNGDGKLTMEELRPRPPQRGGDGEGPERPRQPRAPNFRGGEGQHDGPPPGDAPRPPRAQRPPKAD